MVSTTLTLLFMLMTEGQIASLDNLDIQARSSAAQQIRAEKAAELQERIEFAYRYDKLILALRRFETDYRNGEGRIWPKRSADELAKAMKASKRRRRGATTKSGTGSDSEKSTKNLLGLSLPGYDHSESLRR